MTLGERLWAADWVGGLFARTTVARPMAEKKISQLRAVGGERRCGWERHGERIGRKDQAICEPPLMERPYYFD
jgi:hypothetical protein